MSLKQRLQGRLKAAREFSESLLAAFNNPREWTYQVHPQANHALWFAGHMAVSDNYFLSAVDSTKCRELPGFQEKFGMGSQPVNDPAAYPPPAEVVATMRERRQVLLGVLDQLSDQDLLMKTPPGTPDFLPDVASVFEMAAWHEGMHAGQVTVARRGLGHGPLF